MSLRGHGTSGTAARLRPVSIAASTVRVRWPLTPGGYPPAAATAGLLTTPTRLVFPRQRGGLLPIEEYRRAFDKGCAEVGIEGLVPHGLRHTTASLAISAGG